MSAIVKTVIGGLITEKVTQKFQWLEEAKIRKLTKRVADRDRMIVDLNGDCELKVLAAWERGYESCEREVFRTITLTGWAVEEMMKRQR